MVSRYQDCWLRLVRCYPTLHIGMPTPDHIERGNHHEHQEQADPMPPTMGAARRFITSAPVPMAHMTGSSPKILARPAMAMGRMRSTAPVCTVSSKS